MSVNLIFHGAAGNVTGSCYEVAEDGERYLVDCGLFQERQNQSRNWNLDQLQPQQIRAVLLSHAHLDHAGLLPKLVHDGFNGPIYATSATLEMAEIMLVDAGHIQEEDAEAKRRRHQRENRQGPFSEEPLYTVRDAQDCLPHFRPVEYQKPIDISDKLRATFYDAGHVLGSAMIELQASGDVTKRILFSGDIGRWNKPVLKDPSTFSRADYLIVESTYGDRIHEPVAEVPDKLAAIINDAVAAKGNLIIASFVLERTQELLYYFARLLREHRVPAVPVILDSPTAVAITRIFHDHPEMLDGEAGELVARSQSPFTFANLKLIGSYKESQAIKDTSGPYIVIAGSGMATGGRIKQHLANNLANPACTILFVGYEAQGTLGRLLVDGASEVRVLGQHYPVKARIEQLQGLSAHADAGEIMRWLSYFKEAPRRTFITHGESGGAEALSARIEAELGWKTTVPRYGESFVLG